MGAFDAIRVLLGHSDPVLVRTAFVIAAMVPVSVALALIDVRVLDGANVWLKPLKFQLSVSVFLATMALMMPLVAPTFREGIFGRTTTWVAVVTSIFEIGWITFRAALGERSHYALGTDFGTAMYILMGVAAVLLSLTPLSLAIGMMRARYSDSPRRILRWGLVLGTVVAFVGAVGVGALLSGSPDHYPVNRDDAMARVPVAGWSLERGDLRIAHFVGLHGFQGIAIVSLLLARLPIRLARWVLIFTALGWLAVVGGLTKLAINDQAPIELGVSDVSR